MEARESYKHLDDVYKARCRLKVSQSSPRVEVGLFYTMADIGVVRVLRDPESYLFRVI